MAEGYHDRLVDRIVAGRSIVVLCAPPGFHKSRLAHAAAQKIAANGGHAVGLYGLLEHSADPRAAANAVLTDTRPVIVIDDADSAAGPWLALALEPPHPANSGQGCVAPNNQASDFPLSRKDPQPGTSG